MKKGREAMKRAKRIREYVRIKSVSLNNGRKSEINVRNKTSIRKTICFKTRQNCRFQEKAEIILKARRQSFEFL
jgi:hypothetical protein